MTKSIALPCKIGDQAWSIRNNRGCLIAKEGPVSEMFFNVNMELIIVVQRVGRGIWGEAVFPTKEEAESSIMKGLAKKRSKEVSKQIRCEQIRGEDTLCWTCKKSGGLCSWSSGLVPVEGWEATVSNRNTYMDTDTSSYMVISCPEFEEG